jgi:hypothetical protein
VDVEKRIGVRLPDGYREFLARYNGGSFNEPDIIPTVENCPEDCLTFMHGIGASFECAELANEADLALFDDNNPVQILPIGGTMMGGLIILATYFDDCGNIFYKKAFGDFYYLCGGIQDFVSLLREPQE